MLNKFYIILMQVDIKKNKSIKQIDECYISVYIDRKMKIITEKELYLFFIYLFI